REQYGRRGESVALWLVPRDAIRDVEDWADEFDLKYRRVDGYSIKARLKEARERAGTAGDRWRRADHRVARLRVDRHRADARGGRRLLLDRSERDRTCARRLLAPLGRRGRARLRPRP